MVMQPPKVNGDNHQTHNFARYYSASCRDMIGMEQRTCASMLSRRSLEAFVTAQVIPKKFLGSFQNSPASCPHAFKTLRWWVSVCCPIPRPFPVLSFQTKLCTDLYSITQQIYLEIAFLFSMLSWWGTNVRFAVAILKWRSLYYPRNACWPVKPFFAFLTVDSSSIVPVDWLLRVGSVEAAKNPSLLFA
jgi:hypothetical protein